MAITVFLLTIFQCCFQQDFSTVYYIISGRFELSWTETGSFAAATVKKNTSNSRRISFFLPITYPSLRCSLTLSICFMVDAFIPDYSLYHEYAMWSSLYPCGEIVPSLCSAASTGGSEVRGHAPATTWSWYWFSALLNSTYSWTVTVLV